MSKNEMHCYETIEEFLNGKLTRKETALLLEISERAVTRRAVRVKQLGFVGAKHGNSLKPAKNKTPSTLKREVMQLLEQTYFDHNITHALEMLKAKHGIHISYSTLRSWAHEHRGAAHPLHNPTQQEPPAFGLRPIQVRRATRG